MLPGFLSAEAGAPEDDYIPDDEDTRLTAERQIRIRRGQPKFRLQQMLRFRSTCAITGCQLPDLLEAAHISPYRGDKDNAQSNGLLLRADVHTLFDLNLLTIDPKNLRVVLARSIQSITDYAKFDGKKLVLPSGVKLALTAIKAKYKAFIRAEKDRAS